MRRLLWTTPKNLNDWFDEWRLFRVAKMGAREILSRPALTYSKRILVSVLQEMDQMKIMSEGLSRME